MKKYIPVLLSVFLVACGSDRPADNSIPVLDSATIARNHITDSVYNASQIQMLGELTGHCENKPGVPVRKTVSWTMPAAVSKAENAICGTWVATLGDPALTTGGVMIVGDPNSGKKGMDAIVDAVTNGQRGDLGCAWIEFYDDHTGFWNSCMLNEGTPTALDNVDAFTGEHMGAGVKFEWYLEGKSIRIKFEDCLKFPLAVKDSAAVTARVKYWDMQIVKYGPEKDGMKTCIIRDYLPEYEYKSPVKYEYSYTEKLVSGKVGKYKNAIMD